MQTFVYLKSFLYSSLQTNNHLILGCFVISRLFWNWSCFLRYIYRHLAIICAKKGGYILSNVNFFYFHFFVTDWVYLLLCSTVDSQDQHDGQLLLLFNFNPQNMNVCESFAGRWGDKKLFLSPCSYFLSWMLLIISFTGKRIKKEYCGGMYPLYVHYFSTMYVLYY